MQATYCLANRLFYAPLATCDWYQLARSTTVSSEHYSWYQLVRSTTVDISQLGALQLKEALHNIHSLQPLPPPLSGNALPWKTLSDSVAPAAVVLSVGGDYTVKIVVCPTHQMRCTPMVCLHTQPLQVCTAHHWSSVIAHQSKESVLCTLHEECSACHVCVYAVQDHNLC